MRAAVFLILFCSGFSLFPETSFSAGIAWIGVSAGSREILSGMREIFSEIVPDLRVEVRDNLVDEIDLANTLTYFNRDKDAIVILGGEKVLLKSNQVVTIPLFLDSFSDQIANRENVTGVSSTVGMNRFYTMLRQILPDFDSILFLYPEGKESAHHELEGLKDLSTEYSFILYEGAFKTAEEAESIASGYKEKIDAVLLGSADQIRGLKNSIAAISAIIPLFSFNCDFTPDGALASISADHVKLGRLLAGSVISVLYEGKKAGDIPVKYDRDPQIHVNIATAQNLGIIIPIPLLRVAEVYR